MDGNVTVSSASALPDALRLVEVVLHLFAYLFPKQAKVLNKSSYDFVIVGAGSAGCVLAGRLSEDPNVSVLLIEAGDNPTLEVMLPGLASYNRYSKFDWNYTSVEDPNSYQCSLGNVYETERGHGLGGCSSVNYMIYVRGDPNDYRQWAEAANDSSWDYEHVLPYFKKSERLEDPLVLKSSYRKFHGTTGPVGVTTHPDPGKLKYLKALKEVGYKTVLDTNGDNTLGFNFPMYTVANGFRQSTCYCYVSPVKNRKNLHVLRNTKVNKILFKGNVAVGVQAVTANNEMLTIKANKEVILSAGAFNTPQLLMLSGVGPREHLKSFNITTIKNLPVGYNLQDHSGVLIVHQTESLDAPDPLNPFKPQGNFINGFVALNKSQKYPDTQFTIFSSKTSSALLRLFSTYDSDINTKVVNAGTGKELLVNFVLNLRPKSRGRVMLRSANPNDPPKIHLGVFSDKTDVDNVGKYVEDYLRIEKSEYFKRVKAQRLDLAGDRCKGFTLGSKDYWECYSRCLTFSIFHYSCTCPMGTVVDSRLRVFGIRRLRVVDASVFPIIPSGNTNAPTIMTAEKAADMIKKDHNMKNCSD